MGPPSCCAIPERYRPLYGGGAKKPRHTPYFENHTYQVPTSQPSSTSRISQSTTLITNSNTLAISHSATDPTSHRYRPTAGQAATSGGAPTTAERRDPNEFDAGLHPEHWIGQFFASIDDSQTLPAPSASLSMSNDIVTSTEARVPQLACATGAGRTVPSAATIIALVLFENQFFNTVAISFTALILDELIMVAIWHVYVIISEVVTLGIYAFNIVFLPKYFDLSFVVFVRFGWKVAVIVAVSALFLWNIKAIKSRIAPEATTKTLRQPPRRARTVRTTQRLYFSTKQGARVPNKQNAAR